MATQADMKVVYDLISVAADPAAFKARIDELSKLSSAAEQAASDRIAANRALTEARTIVEDHKIASAKRDETQAAQKSVLDAEKLALEKIASDLKVREQDIVERERRVASERKGLVDREQQLSARAEQVVSAEAAWQEKAKRIHAAANAEIG